MHKYGSLCSPTAITVCLAAFIVITPDPVLPSNSDEKLYEQTFALRAYSHTAWYGQVLSQHIWSMLYFASCWNEEGGLKVLHGHKDTGGEKWKHWTCFMQLERVWSADNVNLICMPFTLVWWYHLVHLIQLNWFADIWFWPQTKDIPGNLQLESDAVGKNCTYLIGLIQGTWLLSDMFSEWFGSPH